MNKFIFYVYKYYEFSSTLKYRRNLAGQFDKIKMSELKVWDFVSTSGLTVSWSPNSQGIPDTKHKLVVKIWDKGNKLFQGQQVFIWYSEFTFKEFYLIFKHDRQIWVKKIKVGLWTLILKIQNQIKKWANVQEI